MHQLQGGRAATLAEDIFKVIENYIKPVHSLGPLNFILHMNEVLALQKLKKYTLFEKYILFEKYYIIFEK